MNIQVPISNLTAEQNDLLDTIYEAAEFLRDNGFNVDVSRVVVSKPTDYPAIIYINGRF